MNQRVLALLVVLALLIGILWAWLAQGRNPSLEPPSPAAASRDGSAPVPALLATEPDSEGTTRALVSNPPDVVDAPPAAPAAPFALVGVLVLDKAMRKPLVGIHVYSIPDNDKLGYRPEQTGRARGKALEILLTDKDGRVEIETPLAIQSIVTGSSPDRTAGFATANVPPLTAGATFDVVLELPTGNDMPFWVKVVDEETQSPLSGVRMRPANDPEGSKINTTDARGLALFEGRSWDHTHLCLKAPDRAIRFVATESGHEREDTALLVSIPRGSTLRVRLVDGAGAHLTGLPIYLTTPAYNLYSRQLSAVWNHQADPGWHASTDDSGRATISDLPAHVPLTATVHFRMEWPAPEPLVLEPGEVREVEWKITSGSDVLGSVEDQRGQPVTGQAIWLRKADRRAPALFQTYDRNGTRSEQTDTQGRFGFSGVSPGMWLVGPEPKERDEARDANSVAPLAQIVEISGDQRVVRVTVRVDRGLFIRGHVLDSSGKPAKLIYVSAYEGELGLLTDTHANATDGAFHLGPLMDGHYTVSAHGSGGDSDSEPITARAGEEKLVLRLRPGAGLSGRVVWDDGKGVAGEVSIANHDLNAPGPYHLSVNNDGQFTIQGLAPGVFDLAATTSNGWIGFIEPVEIGAGAAVKDLVIRVSPGGRVRVRYEGNAKSAKIQVLQRGVVVAGGWVAPGKAEEFPSPAGSVVVRAHYLGDDSRTIERTAERTVEVKAGEMVDVGFEQGTR